MVSFAKKMNCENDKFINIVDFTQDKSLTCMVKFVAWRVCYYDEFLESLVEIVSLL